MMPTLLNVTKKLSYKMGVITTISIAVGFQNSIDFI